MAEKIQMGLYRYDRNKTFTAFTDYARNCLVRQNHIIQLRNRLEEVDLAYMRESDITEEQFKALLANRRRDPTKLQNIQLPTVMQSVENQVSFLTNVFCEAVPMFEYGADRQWADAAVAMNALVEEDQLRFGWLAEFNMAFRDGDKYNLAAVECDWHSETRYVPVTRGSAVVGKEEVYAGNKIKRVDPYNYVFDPTVHMNRQHLDGEVQGYVEPINRVGLKRLLANLGDRRFKHDRLAFESNPSEFGAHYYVPKLNWSVLVQYDSLSRGFDNMDWFAWANSSERERINYKNVYYKTVLYCRIMPAEFHIEGPKDNTPDIWKVILINSVVIYAQPMTELHETLPIVCAQPKCDGLNLQTKSSAEDVQTYQQISSALWNAKLASARRRITDRVLYNPLLIDADHINSPSASAKIPVKQAAYGRPLSEAVYPFPFHDESSQYFIQEASAVEAMALRMKGENNVTQGQFQKGNKLQDEFASVMGNAGSMRKTSAIMWEVQIFQPIKLLLTSNYTQFTIETSRYVRKLKKAVEINGNDLRGMIGAFKVGDGLLPVQRLMRGDVFEKALQFMAQNPALSQAADISGMFVYAMKMQGVEGLEDFLKPQSQVAYEQALQAWQIAAQEAAKAGQPFQQPQPTPDQFGWDPNMKPGEEATNAQPAPALGA